MEGTRGGEISPPWSFLKVGAYDMLYTGQTTAIAAAFVSRTQTANDDFLQFLFQSKYIRDPLASLMVSVAP